MEQLALDQSWWKQLTPAWKRAFAETFFRHTAEPSKEELGHLFHATAIRFAGPAGPYPNMSFELTDLSGIVQLTNLQILVVVHHQVETIREISHLTGLRALFAVGNRIKSLEGVENLSQLEQLYAQNNRIDSIAPVRNLVCLKEFYINSNCIVSLAGLTESHADKLEVFFCKPNDGLKQKEMLRIEREIGIRCRTI